MVGGPSGSVPTASIGAVGTSIASVFYGYGPTGYSATTTLREGKGYWVKVNGSGTLEMTSSAAAPKAAAEGPPGADPARLNILTFRDALGRGSTLFFGPSEAAGPDPSLFELPPPPPAGAFDARFASGRYVEAPSATSGAGLAAIPIALSGASWPLVIGWEIRSLPEGPGRAVLAAGDGGVLATLDGSGSVIVRDAPAGGLSIRFAEEGAIPASYSLGANYPNPFNPVTRFEVSLAGDGPASVTVYDLLGREIRSLMSGRQAAGVRSVEWDGRAAGGVQAPSGVYIVRMSAAGFSASRKIVLMK